jgi:multimeric flavodoxin WrbA
MLAELIAKKVGTQKVTIFDVPKLKIYPCEGNVSTNKGNSCGLLDACLKDKSKNPSGFHRCWASYNNPDDQLWQISKELFKSDAVVFFGSVRWGQMNSNYQKLIERLTWIENRHSTLGENNIVKKIEAGIIIVGQNWKGQEVLQTQKSVLRFFGFKVSKELSWNWQFSSDENDENNKSYLEASKVFSKTFL